MRSWRVIALAWLSAAAAFQLSSRGATVARRATVRAAADDVQAAADAALAADGVMICPAMATSDVARMGEEVAAAVAAGADAIHVCAGAVTGFAATTRLRRESFADDSQERVAATTRL